MSADDERRRAAEIAVGEVHPGMKLGLGTGRTAEYFVRLLGARVREGLDVVAVPTSKKTGDLATTEGIRVVSLDDEPVLDLVVDGADEIDPRLNLIKGGGGALFREKIVASAARKMIVVADAAKVVNELGRFPLPIEVSPFGLKVTEQAIARVARDLGQHGPLTLRKNGEGAPFVTDGGNHILDASFGRIVDPDTLADALKRITGVVEHGLFIGLATTAIVARGDCVEWLSP